MAARPVLRRFINLCLFGLQRLDLIMHQISVQTAMLLTGLSERSVWRRVAAAVHAEGAQAGARSGKAGSRITLERLQKDIAIAMTPEDMLVIQQAEQGDGVAQTEVAIMLMEVDRPELALPWLHRAAEQGYGDAMHLYGQCHILGEGTALNEPMGAHWIARAAASGHPIALQQVLTLRSRGLI
ncbi:MAG: sel1 repeat family protein [Chloroflexia bacterium]|nr:sel1 repeat family protein [Chloroflexia bacterium]